MTSNFRSGGLRGGSRNCVHLLSEYPGASGRRSLVQEVFAQRLDQEPGRRIERSASLVEERVLDRSHPERHQKRHQVKLPGLRVL